MLREEMFVHLNALKHITDKSSMMWLALDMAIKALEQEPKTGHWIYDGRNKICSECNFKIDTWHDTDIGGKRLNYCPKCGTKMEIEK